MSADRPLISAGACRIAIVGNGGGGKSTLARRLATARDLPWREVDCVQFASDWTAVPEDAVRAVIRAWIAEDAWVIDGFGPWDTIEARCQAADVVVFVDHPLWVHNWLSSQRQVDAAIGLGRVGGRADCDLRDFHRRKFETIDLFHREVRPRLVELVSELPAERVVTISGLDALSEASEQERASTPSSDFSLRAASRGDIDALVSLHAAFLEEQAQFLPVDRRNPEFDGADYFRRRLDDPDRATIVAVDGAELRGFVDGMLLRNGGSRVRGLKRMLGIGRGAGPVERPPLEGYLNNVFVRPASRRSSIALALVDGLADWMRDQGAVALFTDVSDGNGAAVRMFEACGFERVRTGMRRPLEP